MLLLFSLVVFGTLWLLVIQIWLVIIVTIGALNSFCFQFFHYLSSKTPADLLSLIIYIHIYSDFIRIIHISAFAVVPVSFFTFCDPLLLLSSSTCLLNACKQTKPLIVKRANLFLEVVAVHLYLARFCKDNLYLGWATQKLLLGYRRGVMFFRSVVSVWLEFSLWLCFLTWRAQSVHPFAIRLRPLYPINMWLNATVMAIRRYIFLIFLHIYFF